MPPFIALCIGVSIVTWISIEIITARPIFPIKNEVVYSCKDAEEVVYIYEVKGMYIHDLIDDEKYLIDKCYPINAREIK
jgi:hypothetical protein